MQKFDCLALDCPLFGSHLLEASAGTGKTFAIEHIIVRLILKGIDLEQILAITFTRAATRELKARIRSNLEKAMHAIQIKNSSWDYLKPHLGLDASIKRLSDALALFDQCQIFTIHGFCFRLLKEFAFEAKAGFFTNPDEKIQIPKSLREAAIDFLEHGIDPKLLCIEQVALLFKEFDSMEELLDKLLKCDEVKPALTFSQIEERCKAALHKWRLEEGKLLEDFSLLEKNYKLTVKGDFVGQVKAIAHLNLGVLLKEKGSVFKFLHPENRKVRAEDPKFLNYPGFFDWAQKELVFFFQQKVFPVIHAAFQPIKEKILEEEEHFDPDEILICMQSAIGNDRFRERILEKYKVAIIDEFQDTDAVQWDIFQKLFFSDSLRALYLVGDPKQSIYRFRKADIYTYLQAKERIGETNCYLLDTNFRSSKPLIQALNALFERDWIRLPKIKGLLPYHPVKAGATIETDFNDEKGAVHFVFAEGESLFEEFFLPYAVSEIERLQLKKCAILVKDRYQANLALEVLKNRGIPAVAKSHTPIGKTESYQAIVELFDAILNPKSLDIVMKGPFSKSDLYLPEYKAILEKKGLVALARELTLDTDGMQIFELLFAWEKKEGFSFEGLFRYLKELKKLKAEEGGSRRMEINEEAIQIMTLHISKGLEFEVVFALGLSSRTPEGEEPEELDAEKMRQLYVAMTRAKKRLYVPVGQFKKEAEIGTHSPMELFAKYFEGSFATQIQMLSQKESITFENLTDPIQLPPPKLGAEKKLIDPSFCLRPYQTSMLSSFTTLARTKEIEKQWQEPKEGEYTLQTMPRGTETGVLIHSIFEHLLSAKSPLWRNPSHVNSLVEERLFHSPLELWKAPIQQMVHKVLTMPLQGDGEWFTLSEIDRFQVEMEFVFSLPPDFIKGFIDLIFMVRNKVYFLDWKTNWLENYEPQSLEREMDSHDYFLQASLYSEAIRRHFQKEIGGSYYVFVRGCLLKAAVVSVFGR